jgi:hypothetical protein
MDIAHHFQLSLTQLAKNHATKVEIRLLVTPLNASGKRYVLLLVRSQLTWLALLHSGILKSADTSAHQHLSA